MGKVFLIKAPRTKDAAQHATALALFPMTGKRPRKCGIPARFFKHGRQAMNLRQRKTSWPYPGVAALADAPTIRQLVQTIRGPKAGTGTSPA
jgi:hypothetical protein